MRTIYLVVGLLAVLSVTGHVSAQNTKDVAEEDSPVHTILIMNKDLLESMKQRAAAMEQMMGRRAGAFHAHHAFPGRDKSAGEPHGFKKDPASDAQPETTRAFPGFGVRAEPLKTKPEEPRATAILASSAHVDRHAHPHRPCLFRRAKHWFKQVMGAPPQHPRRPEAADEEGPLRRGPPPPPSAVDALLALLVVLVPVAAGSWLIFHGTRSLLHCSRRAAGEPQFMSANPGLVYASQHAYQALPAKEAAV
ncbi:hypothetical protein QBZ16_000512 [Prototheca wickerhamii]|uniref:Uncharacterized protein n=1 Tax=Prototheca wickerhamii TaxID=3111 RepID=A0AAD9MN36_PROWI|nr:hypothetical protein QBZ16_000512 [Prototheca wickerhamii]